MTSVKMILSQWIVMFDHTHRGSCGRAVNRSFSPGMVWVSLQILQSLVGLGTLNPFPPSPLFTGLCLTLCGMLLYHDLSPTRSMLWGGGGGVWVRTGKKVVRNGCVFRWMYSKPTACSADLSRIWEGNGCHHSNWNFSVWWCMLKIGHLCAK